MFIIHVRTTLNNILVTCLNSQDFILWGVTPSSLGFKGSKKGSLVAAKVLGEHVGTRLLKEGRNGVFLRFLGIGPGRFSFVSGLRKSGILIKGMEDRTQLPHNGCKLSKKRRI